MAKIKVGLPEVILFNTRILIQIGDINYGNHLANDAVLRICHEARVRWLASLGFSEVDADGVGLIMVDAAIQYLSQAYYGDELLVDIGVDDITGVGFTLLYHLTHVVEGKSVARVQTGMVCFDYITQRVSRLSLGLKRELG